MENWQAPCIKILSVLSVHNWKSKQKLGLIFNYVLSFELIKFWIFLRFVIFNWSRLFEFDMDVTTEEQRAFIKVQFLRKVEPPEIHSNLLEACGEAAFGLRNVQKWCNYNNPLPLISHTLLSFCRNEKENV